MFVGLRKMNTQKEITIKTTDRSKLIFLLLIKDYKSSTTTKNELIQIFNKSGIHVHLLHDVFPDLSPPSPVEKMVPMEIQMEPSLSSSSSDDRIDILERRIARLETLLAKMGVVDE